MTFFGFSTETIAFLMKLYMQVPAFRVSEKRKVVSFCLLVIVGWMLAISCQRICAGVVKKCLCAGRLKFIQYRIMYSMCIAINVLCFFCTLAFSNFGKTARLTLFGTQGVTKMVPLHCGKHRDDSPSAAALASPNEGCSL